jgi:hypothetical protein
MRMIPLFAAFAFATGLSASPAAADTRLTQPVSATGLTTAGPVTATPAADQYRERRWRGDRWRGNNGWRGDRWRGGNRWHGNRGWRRGGVVCRTSWRYGRPRRVCWRR